MGHQPQVTPRAPVGAKNFTKKYVVNAGIKWSLLGCQVPLCRVLPLDLVKKVDHLGDQGLSGTCHLSPSNKIKPTKYTSRQITTDKTTRDQSRGYLSLNKTYLVSKEKSFSLKYRVFHVILHQEEGCCELIFLLLRSPKASM